MRTYSFAPISAREYPTLYILENPFIWGGVGFCLNVSEKPYPPEIIEVMKRKGIAWYHIPISETDFTKSWSYSLYHGLQLLAEAYTAGKKIIVHCDFGNNRSRTFIEAFHFYLTGEELLDEYKGEINHFAYNCRIGHLSPLDVEEAKILNIRRSVCSEE